MYKALYMAFFLAASLSGAQQSAPTAHTGSDPGTGNITEPAPEQQRPQLISAPEVTVNTAPCKFPFEATSYLEFSLNELGKAEKITPLILPNDPSNKNAIAILSGDQFKPATLRGAPVSSNELIKIKTYLCSDKKTFFTKQPEQRLLSFVTMDGDATLLTNLQETDAPGQLPTTTAYIRHKGSYISTPGVLNTPSIELTPAFKDAGKRGTIELLVLVDVKGKAYFLGFLRTLGMGMDEETRDSVSRYHFTPAVNLKNKQKVPAIVAIVQEFTYNP